MLLCDIMGLLSVFRLSYARDMKILRHRWLFLIVGFTVLAPVSGCGEPGKSEVAKKKVVKAESEEVATDATRTQIQQVSDSENLLLQLSPKIKRVGLGLIAGGESAEAFLSPEFKALGPAEAELDSVLKDAHTMDDDAPVSSFEWPIDSAEKTVALEELFAPVSGESQLQDVQIGTLKATLVEPNRFEPVSYTHLTLPTICSV